MLGWIDRIDLLIDRFSTDEFHCHCFVFSDLAWTDWLRQSLLSLACLRYPRTHSESEIFSSLSSKQLMPFRVSERGIPLHTTNCQLWEIRRKKERTARIEWRKREFPLTLTVKKNETFLLLLLIWRRCDNLDKCTFSPSKLRMSVCLQTL